jgi:tetratricopeptide (TPR) repeat protein
VENVKIQYARLAPGVLLAGLLVWPAAANDPGPEALIQAGHWKRARPLVEQRYQADPSDAHSAYLLSQVKAAFGDLDAAVPLAQKAVALDAENAAYHLQLGIVCGETAERASLFAKAGWAHRFKEETDKAAALDAKNLDARFALMEYYLQAPRLMGGSKDKAAAMAEEISRINPTRGYLAQARLAQADNDAAREGAAYLKALATAPEDYEILVSTAAFYNRETQKKYDQAEKQSRQAVKINPGQVSAYSSLAFALAARERWPELDAALAEAEQNVPDDLSPYYQAGRALLYTGRDLTRAERYFRRYLGQPPEGEAPTLAHAHWRLGLVFEKEGHKPEAVSEIETALRLRPDLSEAKKDLKRLQGS